MIFIFEAEVVSNTKRVIFKLSSSFVRLSKGPGLCQVQGSFQKSGRGLGLPKNH